MSIVMKPNIEPPKESELISLECAWNHLSWTQKKILRLKASIAKHVICHIVEMELLKARIDRKISRTVLYFIFPAHWLNAANQPNDQQPRSGSFQQIER